MKLSDKLRYLREVEGSLRGLNRAMTQQELVRAIAQETHSKLSQSYLSQIESGARPHLTNTTRLLLARFFKVHPGYLVEDPEGYHAELLSDLRTEEGTLDLWLIAGSDRFHRDPELCRALRLVARHADSRRCLLLLESILETPELLDRLLGILRPAPPAAVKKQHGSALSDGFPLPDGNAHPASSRQASRSNKEPAGSGVAAPSTRTTRRPSRKPEKLQ